MGLFPLWPQMFAFFNIVVTNFFLTQKLFGFSPVASVAIMSYFKAVSDVMLVSCQCHINDKSANSPKTILK